MAKRLPDIASKASIMNVIIRYEGEKYKFNLYQELAINEDGIQSEVLNQPTSYAFLEFSI